MSNEEIVNQTNENVSTKKTKTKTKKSKSSKAKKTKTTKTKKSSTKTKKTKKSVKELESSLDAVEQVVSTPEVVEKVESVSAEVSVPETDESVEDSKYEESIKSIDSSLTSVQSHLEFLLKVITECKLQSKSVKSIHKVLRPIEKIKQKISDELMYQALRRCDESTKLLSKKHRSKNKGKTNMNSGIQKPHPAHAKLAKFMGVEEGHPVSIVDALKAVAAYVKEHNLQTDSDKRRFKVVNELHELFGVDEMGYTQIMGNLKPFFPPAEKSSKKSS